LKKNKMRKNNIEEIKRIVRRELKCSAHDFDHIMRVYNMAMRLAKEEKGEIDMDILKPATLLHDIGRVKEDKDKTGKICHASESAVMSSRILKKLEYGEEEIKKIRDCIITHRYKTGKRPRSIEAKILFDADKLDSLGAIFIMRAGIWLGRNDGKIFPEMRLKDYVRENIQGGKNNGRIRDNSRHSLYYEYELKTKELPSLMHTKSGRKIAKERLKFVSMFLDRLRKEAAGEI